LEQFLLTFKPNDQAMKDAIKFSVPKPCHEDWNAMTPDQKGRFCSACSKTVVDFTNLDNTEVQEYLSENKGSRICGRFTSEQLSPEFKLTVPQSVLYQKRSFHKAFLLALFVTMGTTLFSCKNFNNQTLGEVSIIEDSTSVQKDTAEQVYEVGEVAPDSFVKGKVLPPPPPPKKHEVKFVKSAPENDHGFRSGVVGIVVAEPLTPEIDTTSAGTLKQDN
jgi:hypothetical protein